MEDTKLIDCYSRAQATEGGVLIDVTEMAHEAGFRFPVALTRAVWCQYVEVPGGVEAQDESGRLWDILWMLKWEIGRCIDGRDELLFEVLVRNDNRQARPVTLKSVCGPGDELEPVITVMLPDED